MFEIVSSQGSRCIYTMLIECEPYFLPFLSLLGLLNKVIVNLTKVTAIHFSDSPPLIRGHRFAPVFQEVFLEHLAKDDDILLETAYFIFACIVQSHHMHRLWDVNSVQQSSKHGGGFLSLEGQGERAVVVVEPAFVVFYICSWISIHAGIFSPDIIWKWFIFRRKERALVSERCPLESLWQAGLLLLLPSQVDLHLHITHRFWRGCKTIPKQDKVNNVDSAFIFFSNDISFFVRL